MDGARAIFLSQGFDGASMNDVARAAAVSKGTLYVYFDSKERLFEALIREERRQQAEQLCDAYDADLPPAQTLRDLGLRLLEIMSRPETLAHARTVIAATSKFPQLGRAFFEAGPLYGAGRLEAYLRRHTELGALTVPDPNRAAWQFIELCQAKGYKALLFGVVDRLTSEEIETAVDAAVALFMAAYGPRN